MMSEEEEEEMGLPLSSPSPSGALKPDLVLSTVDWPLPVMCSSFRRDTFDEEKIIVLNRYVTIKTLQGDL